MAEIKSSAVVRKVFDYEHIAQRRPFSTFCCEYFNLFLNFHRSCLFATEPADSAKLRCIKRIYRSRDVIDTLEKPTRLPDVAQYLRGVNA